MKIEYSFKVSKKARRMRLEFSRSRGLVAIVPKDMNYDLVDRFITEKSKWIFNKINYFKSIKNKIFLNGSKREYLKYKDAAKILTESKIKYYNRLYNCKVNKVSIKNQKSRWGSCSKKGNLNFNYKIALLPDNLANYIIVHELCHLIEFNHSKKFWKLVELTIPNYKELRKRFK